MTPLQYPAPVLRQVDEDRPVCEVCGLRHVVWAALEPGKPPARRVPLRQPRGKSEAAS